MAELLDRDRSPEDTDLERIVLRGPRIKHLRDLFVIESGAPVAITNSLCVSACEYRGGVNTRRGYLARLSLLGRGSAVRRLRR